MSVWFVTNSMPGRGVSIESLRETHGSGGVVCLQVRDLRNLLGIVFLKM